MTVSSASSGDNTRGDNGSQQADASVKEEPGERSGGGSSNGKKRKLDAYEDDSRSSDGDKEEEKKEDDDIRPDSVVSSKKYEDQEESDGDEHEVPDGEFPTIIQLDRILTMIASAKPLVSRGDDNKNKNDKFILRKLHSLRRWIGIYHQPDASETEKQKSVKFFKNFLDLGGILRLAFFIRKNMGNARRVEYAARVYFPIQATRGELRKEKWYKTAMSRFIEHDCVRIFILAIEEQTPSTKTEGINPVGCLWKALAGLFAILHTDSFDFNDNFLSLAEKAVDFLKEKECFKKESDIHILLNSLANICFVLDGLLYHHPGSMTAFCRQNNVGNLVSKKFKLCQSVWLQDDTRCLNLIQFVHKWIDNGLIRGDDLKQWPLLAAKSLEKHPSHAYVPKYAFTIIKKSCHYN